MKLSHLGKKTGHVLFPYVWHYFTDTYKGRFHHLIVDSILSLCIMVLLAVNVSVLSWLFLFSIPPQFSINLSVPPVVISGEPLTLAIDYHNAAKPISNVRFEVYAPTGFTSFDHTSEIVLPSIASDAREQLTIPGKFIGIVNGQYRFVVLYRYDYYGLHYTDVAQVTFTPSQSSFEVVSDTPEQILNNEPFTWLIDYYNNSQYERQGSCIRLNIPDAFQVTASSITIPQDQQIIFETLAPGEHGQISISGSFHNAVGEGHHLLAVTASDQCDDRIQTQTALTSLIQVLSPRLQLALTGAGVIGVGDRPTYQLTYTNAGDVELTHMVLTARLSNQANHVSSISTRDGSVTGDTVTWVDDVLLLPGERRTKYITLNTNPNQREKNVALGLSASGTAVLNEIDVATYATPAQTSMKFNSTLTFEAISRYTSVYGEPLGYGPYPLQSDNITALRVFWQVEDFTNDLANVTIRTTLPNQVEWTGHSSVTEGSAITYDAATRTVTWHTGSIPSFSHAQGANFEVRVLPNWQQEGKYINIINDTFFTARDSFTGVVLSRAVGPLRTAQPIQPAE